MDDSDIDGTDDMCVSYTCMYMCTNLHIISAWEHMHIYIYIYIYICMYVYNPPEFSHTTHMYTHTCQHPYIHMHTYTHTYMPASFQHPMPHLSVRVCVQ